jgi:hypothetical protein
MLERNGDGDLADHTSGTFIAAKPQETYMAMASAVRPEGQTELDSFYQMVRC